MHLSIFSLAALLLLGGCATSESNTAKPVTYCINSSITQNGKTVGAPVIQAMAGQTASIIVDGTTPFSMLVTATPETGGRIRLVADISTNGGHIAPTMVVREGKAATISNENLTWTATTTRCEG